MPDGTEADQKAPLSAAKSQDFAFAVFSIVLGGAGYFGAQHLERGTPARMGPGFIPTALSLALCAMGLILLAWSLARSRRLAVEPWALKNLAIIFGSMAAFALTLKPLGLALSLMLLVVISSFAAADRRWHETVILAVVAAVVSIVLFVYLLGLHIPVWPF